MGIYIELFSNLIQTFTLTWFISSFFGYKYFGIIKYLGVFIIWFAEFIAISYMNLIIVYGGRSATWGRAHSHLGTYIFRLMSHLSHLAPSPFGPKLWLKPKYGVATKHLANYMYWFNQGEKTQVGSSYNKSKDLIYNSFSSIMELIREDIRETTPFRKGEVLV